MATSRSPRTFLAIGCAAVAVLALMLALVELAQRAGHRMAQEHAARLQLLWPDLMTMPVNDRAILVGLADTCRLERRPLLASEVVACLRQGVQDNDPMLPKGVDRKHAAARLDALLAIAAAKAKREATRDRPSRSRTTAPSSDLGGPQAHGD